MNDLSSLDEDFKQRADYREALLGRAKDIARDKISQYAQQAGVDKNLSATLKLTAGEEGEAALAAPAIVEGVRQGVGYAAQAAQGIMEGAKSAAARMGGGGASSLENNMNINTSADAPIYSSADIAEGKVPEFGASEGAGAEVGLGEAAAEATGAAAVAEGAGELAVSNWWNVLGWGAAAVAVGSAIYSGVEAAEADSQAKTQQNLASTTQAQTPNMPSFAGRYVVPVQNALQNE